jgi:hypothetical protein
MNSVNFGARIAANEVSDVALEALKGKMIFSGGAAVFVEKKFSA